MKFKEHNTTTTGAAGHYSMPTINFGKAGNITISKVAREAMNLTPGDKIDFIQDEEKPQDWYIKVGTLNGFKVRNLAAAAGSRGLGFSCKNLVREVARSLNISEKVSFKCIMSIQPFRVEEMDFDLWPIITKSATTITRGSERRLPARESA